MGFNLGVVVLMSLFDEKSSGNWLRKVEQVIVDSEELVDGAEKAKQLNTLCGLLDVTSEQRLHVLKRVVQVCKHDGLGSVLEPAIPNQLSQVIRNVQPQTAQTTATAVILLTELADLYLADPEKQAVAFEVMKLRLTYFDDNADAAIDLIVRAINLPNYFAFDSLASIPAIHALPKSSPALAVLNLFIAGDYAAYSSSSLAALSPLINIQTAQTKLRLIAISVYGSEHIASSIPLASIASLIDVPSEQVELWIIDSIRLGLINAKIDQLSNSVVITKTSFASFGLPQWRLLSSLLSSWESSLSQLLPTITNAKLAAKLSASNEGAAVVEISSKK
ncbi:Eukaryotic translation initiation factor 3 subunit M [Zancudomyces culisetae]|uniref:Eukaryotic translation initiation factor 3 subunit M n=1 Tax=Zancudomyces culisetae TaxID=1213189 RepID=A0A1R1PJ29_ZANCU|nr:Eukaryotic translation initiation factor 3 subunit M [Zancudomyces culisetae]|eukprot:OMH80966.1 Eukaryotic translation initiation factor 3 subunit M [Zancudomyces culisetae]